jgi:muramoyltetrapeptide carboxypeptidase
MERSTRRQFLQGLGGTLLGSQLPVAASERSQPLIKPRQLVVGDTVGLISPASAINQEDLTEVREFLTAYGFKVKVGEHVLDRYGYLAGRDADRAADVNAMFADDGVQAILTMRGGWGCNRILPLLDYDLIRRHPKILMGFSDITSLLLAIIARSGVITFHGPVGISTWNWFDLNYVERILLNKEAILMQNLTSHRVETITPGKTRGRLLGGNLSVLAAMVGSPYLPPWKNTILFVEEVGEEIYRVDRMLTQLKLGGILEQLAGLIFANCSDCSKEEDREPTLTLAQVLSELIAPLGIPAWYGSMIGHIQNNFTVPLGVEVEIDAERGTILMLEPAVL